MNSPAPVTSKVTFILLQFSNSTHLHLQSQFPALFACEFQAQVHRCLQMEILLLGAPAAQGERQPLRCSSPSIFLSPQAPLVDFDFILVASVCFFTCCHHSRPCNFGSQTPSAAHPLSPLFPVPTTQPRVLAHLRAIKLDIPSAKKGSPISPMPTLPLVITAC